MVKGCLNPKCELSDKKNKQSNEESKSNRLKRTFKHEDNYCSRCGIELCYVCKICNTSLPDDSENICVRCKANIEDDQNKKKERFAKVGGVLAVGAAVATNMVRVFNKKN